MDAPELTLDLLADELAVCRLPVDAAIPNWAWSGELTSITSSDDELSVVCAADPVPDDVQHTPGWRALRVHGQLDFGLVGILAGLSKALADAGISIFAISTYDTDYLLVRNEQLGAAVEALTAAGYAVRETRESL
jgi:hypothetical protein